MNRLLLVFSLFINTSIFGATYYVATNGNDNNPGTISQPFATWQKGFMAIRAGDILYIRGGVYYTSGSYLGDQYNGVYVVTTSGTEDKPIKVMAYQGETPILDCSNMNGSGTRAGIYLGYLSYWHIKGLTVRYVRGTVEYHGRGITHDQASHVTYEQCTVYNCGDGFSSGGFSDYCYWINCDSHDNVDLKAGGGFADGFKLSNYKSGGNTHLFLYGCRSWHNSDDGFDFLNADGNSKGGYGELDNCWSFNNGHSGGNGVGFKMGGYIDGSPDGGIQRTIKRCAAWNNSNAGFDECCITAIIDGVFYNNIAYNNNTYHQSGAAGFKFDYTNYSANHIFRNNISLGNYWEEALTPSPKCTHDHNTWDSNVTVTSADFLSLDPTGVDGPRQSDGSLPNLNFLRLAPGSDLINKGVDVNLSYGGTAPDMGPFESDIESYVPPAPVYASSLIANSTPSQLEMTYNTSLASIIPASSAFSVQVNSVARNVTSVSVSGTKVTLTLAAPVVYSDKTTVAYTVPAANPLQSSAGQPAGALSARSVSNNVYPPSPIYLSSAVQNSDPSVLEINFSLPLANILPSPTAFIVTVNSSPRTVTSVSISGTKVLLKLASPITYGSRVTFSYTRPSANPLQSTQGGWSSSLSTQGVTNNVDLALPVFVSSSIENSAPSVIEINYNLSLGNIAPSAPAFTVIVNSTVRSVNSVTVSGTKVKLTLTSPVVYGNSVTLAYTKPSSNPLQTPQGGQAASLSTQTVNNNISAPTIVTPPAVVNTPPVVIVSNARENNSGFIGSLNASGSYDADRDNLTYTWRVPDNIPVSATTGPVIEFLAPIVSTNQTFNFTVTVSDGKAPQSKTVPVEIVPYHPGLETAEIISVEAAEFQSPNQPDYVIDGNKGTLWSVNGDNQWIVLELQAPYDIRHIIIAFQPGQKKEFYFDILGSNDKKNWEQILTRAKSCPFSGDLQVFDFPASKTEKEFRYIKLVGQGNSLDKWNYISEFRIFGYRHKNPADYEQLIVKIYPNPAQDLVNIVIDEPSFVPDFIKILTLTGKIIYFENADPDIRHLQIPINFKQGIYIVQMGKGDLTMFTQKLVVNQ